MIFIKPPKGQMGRKGLCFQSVKLLELNGALNLEIIEIFRRFSKGRTTIISGKIELNEDFESL